MTEAKINEAREHYRPAATLASLLSFIMNDLGRIHPMYQFSLQVTDPQSPLRSQHSSVTHPARLCTRACPWASLAVASL